MRWPRAYVGLLGVPVERPTVLESTALGAAYMAGLAVGLWRDFDDLESHREVDRVFEPQMSDEVRRRELDQWKKAVERSLQWATEETT